MSRISFRRILISLLFLLCCTGIAAADTEAGGDFLPPDQAFSYDKEITDDGKVKLHWSVEPGYYMYRSRLEVEGEPSDPEAVDCPDGEEIEDEYFGEQEVYKEDYTVKIDPGDADKLKLTWQGCAEEGLCYPPQNDTIELPDQDSAADSSSDATASDSDSAPDSTASASAADQGSEDQAIASRLAEGHVAWTLLAFLGLGIMLAFTPCVLPMVPIISGVVVGTGARGLRGLTLSLAFVLPMALTYAVLGVVAALAGANLQAALQTPAVLGVFAAIFVVLALAMFGLFELQLPAPIRNRLNQASANRQGGHLGSAAAMGVISAVLVGPCMTAPLAGALLYIADTGNALLGGSALLALGLGMGVPLLIVGTVGAQLLPKPGTWMNAVKVVFGFILLAMAVWLLSRVVPASIMLGLWGALTLAIGITLWHGARNAASAPDAKTMIGIVAGILISLWGSIMIIGAAGGGDQLDRPLAFLEGSSQADGQADEDEDKDFMDRFQDIHNVDELKKALDEAEEQGKWAIIDYYADWCVSCKVIEKQVFGDEKVQKELDDVVLLRPDVTKDNEETRNLLKALKILGPPTIALVGPDGMERRDARIVGELSADEFLEHWDKAQNSDKKQAIAEGM